MYLRREKLVRTALLSLRLQHGTVHGSHNEDRAIHLRCAAFRFGLYFFCCVDFLFFVFHGGFLIVC